MKTLFPVLWGVSSHSSFWLSDAVAALAMFCEFDRDSYSARAQKTANGSDHALEPKTGFPAGMAVTGRRGLRTQICMIQQGEPIRKMLLVVHAV